jgi:hypothetical protein
MTSSSCPLGKLWLGTKANINARPLLAGNLGLDLPSAACVWCRRSIIHGWRLGMRQGRQKRLPGGCRHPTGLCRRLPDAVGSCQFRGSCARRGTRPAATVQRVAGSPVRRSTASCSGRIRQRRAAHLTMPAKSFRTSMNGSTRNSSGRPGRQAMMATRTSWVVPTGTMFICLTTV